MSDFDHWWNAHRHEHHAVFLLPPDGEMYQAMRAAYEAGRAEERQRILAAAVAYWRDTRHASDGYVPAWFADLLDGDA